MDNPQEGLKYIHVGGTNGKGSTSLIIANILNKAGYKVGRYTSPHLTSYCERFTVNNEPITPAELKTYLDSIDSNCRKMLAKGLPHPTEFEVLTAVAFQFFRDKGVDIAVMEVGMGGIYDSTNVITPLVSVITSISYDHTFYLGETTKEIAWNKAGIIKSGVPVVAGLMDDKASAVIKAQADSLNSPFISSQVIKVEEVKRDGIKGTVIRFSGALTSSGDIFFSLIGQYQLENLATALAALTCLKETDYKISATAIKDGLSSLTLNGRMQVLNEDPLVIADAAHNEAGAGALGRSLAAVLQGRSKVAVIGIVDDKDARAMLMSLGSNTKAGIITKPEGDRGDNWERVALIWQELYPDITAIVEPDIHQAVSQGLKLLAKDDYLLVTGSFYVLRKACQYKFK